MYDCANPQLGLFNYDYWISYLITWWTLCTLLIKTFEVTIVLAGCQIWIYYYFSVLETQVLLTVKIIACLHQVLRAKLMIRVIINVVRKDIRDIRNIKDTLDCVQYTIRWYAWLRLYLKVMPRNKTNIFNNIFHIAR